MTTKPKIKLTDALINYSSGKTAPKDLNLEWQPFNDTLKTKGGIIRDSKNIGFSVKRSGKSTIAFRYEFRFNGIKENITLGQFPKITTAQARKLANDRAKDISNNINPLAEKQTARIDQGNTLKSYLDHDYKLYMRRAITGDVYLSMIEKHYPELLKKPLADIVKTDLVKWVQGQMKQYYDNEQGYSSASIKKRYSALKSLMSHAVRNQVITHNPFNLMDKLDFHRDESTRQQLRRTYLEIEQQQVFLSSVDNYEQKLRKERRNSRAHGKLYLGDLDNVIFASHHKPMLLILYYMGMRPGDVIGLEWSHIIDTPFTSNITKVLEKTRRKVKDPFILPMPPQVRDALKAWNQQQDNPKVGLVFPNPKTGKRMDKQCLKRCWKWIKQDAGFHDELQLYSLRHNFISWLVMNGTPLKVVASMAGHRTTTMIDLHYGHLIKGATKQASDGFACLLEAKA